MNALSFTHNYIVAYEMKGKPAWTEEVRATSTQKACEYAMAKHGNTRLIGHTLMVFCMKDDDPQRPRFVSTINKFQTEQMKVLAALRSAITY